MCGIFGIVGSPSLFSRHQLLRANMRRGRDGYGVFIQRYSPTTYGGVAQTTYKTPGRVDLKEYGNDPFLLYPPTAIQAAIGNFRAEPTTELVPTPSDNDQQPYSVGSWTIVHNGVIANDKRLIAAHNFNPPTRIDSWVIAAMLDCIERSSADLEPHEIFGLLHEYIEGSFAIIAMHEDTPGRLYYMTDYRPLYHATYGTGSPRDQATVLSSVSTGDAMRLIQPYTWGTVEDAGISPCGTIRRRILENRTLVVLSGGLDSTAAAAMLIDKGHTIGLLHFDYGCRATSRELHAVQAIADHFGAPLTVVNMRDIFKQIGGSRLTGTTHQINNGEAGAEQAIEWVPARNTILASVAMGIAEANDYSHIALGINLEESGGGYTDNVVDLYEGLNGLSQWIVGYGKRVTFLSPVGSMMKHEIVAAGVEANAPFHLTWSCYNAGNMHCGECGPCIMRKRAFERNGMADPVFMCEETN